MAERRLNYLVFVPVLVMVLIVAAFGYKLWEDQTLANEGRDPNALPSAMVGKTVPELTLQPMPGKTPFTSAVLKEPGVKLVNFWASWCPPCRAEHPNLVMLQKEGVKIYGINYKDKPADAEKFLSERSDPFTALAADPQGRNGINWGVIAMPETFVVDGKGTIVLRYPGPLTQQIIEEMIRPAMKKAEAAG